MESTADDPMPAPRRQVPDVPLEERLAEWRILWDHLLSDLVAPDDQTDDEPIAA